MVSIWYPWARARRDKVSHERIAHDLEKWLRRRYIRLRPYGRLFASVRIWNRSCWFMQQRSRAIDAGGRRIRFAVLGPVGRRGGNKIQCTLCITNASRPNATRRAVGEGGWGGGGKHTCGGKTSGGDGRRGRKESDRPIMVGKTCPHNLTLLWLLGVCSLCLLFVPWTDCSILLRGVVLPSTEVLPPWVCVLSLNLVSSFPFHLFFLSPSHNFCFVTGLLRPSRLLLGTIGAVWSGDVGVDTPAVEYSTESRGQTRQQSC